MNQLAEKLSNLEREIANEKGPLNLSHCSNVRISRIAGIFWFPLRGPEKTKPLFATWPTRSSVTSPPLR